MKLDMGSCETIPGLVTWGTKYRLNNECSPQNNLCYNPRESVIPYRHDILV